MAPDNSDGKRPDIVIIDDSPSIQQILTETFQQQDSQIRVFANGYQAMLAIKKDPPDIILLDVAMPEINGYELCRLCKSEPALKDIPIIFISGYNTPADKLRAFETGGADYITKPFQLKDVQERVAKALANRHPPEAPVANTESLPETPASVLDEMMIRLDQIRLQDGQLLSPVSLGNLEKIQVLGRQLTERIKDVRKARPTDRILRPVFARCDPIVLVNDALEKFKPVAITKERYVVFQGLVGTPIPPLVDVDYDLLIRVLEILLNIAISFKLSTKGTMTVGIEIEDLWVLIWISNLRKRSAGQAETMIDIPETIDDESLDMFNFPPSSGISFCRAAIEAHGGKFGVKCEVDNECSFGLRLPIYSR